MTDAHYHRGGYATFLSVGDREFSFRGVHPWEAADASARRPYQAAAQGATADTVTRDA